MLQVQEGNNLTNPLITRSHDKPKNEHQNKLRSSCILSSINSLGHVLTTPTSLLLADAVRIFVCKITPGDHGQSNYKAVEVAGRVLRFLRLPLLIACTLTIGFIGAGLRTFTSALTKQDLVLMTPSSEDADNHDLAARNSDKLKVGTFNVGAGPDMMSLRNKLAKPLDRVKDWVDLLRDDDKLGGCDVVFFQEMFHTEATEKFLEQMKDKYPYAVYNVGSQRLGLSSGLVVISKVPLEDPKFWAHGVNRVGDDQFANKGLLAVTARIGAASKAVLFTTHLNGGGSAKIDGKLVRSDECRARQLTAIMLHQEEYRTEANDKANDEGTKITLDILGGDLNIGRFTDKGWPDSEWDSKVWSELLSKSRNMMDQDLSDPEAVQAKREQIKQRMLKDEEGQIGDIDKQKVAAVIKGDFEEALRLEDVQSKRALFTKQFLVHLDAEPDDILLYEGTTFEMGHRPDQAGNRPKTHEMVDFQFVPDADEYRNVKGMRKVLDIGRASDHAAVVIDYEGLNS